MCNQKKEGNHMAVRIKNSPINQNKERHPISQFRGFIDKDGDFFIINENNTIIYMGDDFYTFNLDKRYSSIEEFLECEFETELIRAYEEDDFDITIDLK